MKKCKKNGGALDKKQKTSTKEQARREPDKSLIIKTKPQKRERFSAVNHNF